MNRSPIRPHSVDEGELDGRVGSNHHPDKRISVLVHTHRTLYFLLVVLKVHNMSDTPRTDSEALYVYIQAKPHVLNYAYHTARAMVSH